jgi:hypothetical protein
VKGYDRLVKPPKWGRQAVHTEFWLRNKSDKTKPIGKTAKGLAGQI